jgi:uncharacterized phage-associated protein
MRGFQYRSAVQALNFFANKAGGSVNAMKALKLVWLADRYHLCQHGRTITGDEFFAMKLGPVASGTRDLIQSNENILSEDEINYFRQFLKKDGYRIESIKDIYLKVFSMTDKETLESVWETFGDMDEYALSNYTHEFPEWKQHKSGLDRGIFSRKLILEEDMISAIDDSKGFFNLDPSHLSDIRVIYQEHKMIELALA